MGWKGRGVLEGVPRGPKSALTLAVSASVVAGLLLGGCGQGKDPGESGGDVVPPPSSGPPVVELSAGPGWPVAGQNLHNTRSQPDETILGADNVSRLTLKWQAQLEGSVLATPAIQDGAIFIPDTKGYLYRLDAATGDVVWKREVSEYVDRKGDVIRATPAITQDLLIFGTQGNKLLKEVLNIDQETYVVAVEKETGDLRWRKDVGRIRAPRITQSAVVWDDKVFVGTASGQENLAFDPLFECCTHRGSLLQLDASNGEILHQQYTIPDIEGLSGGSVWGSTAVIDEERRRVYVTTGNNYSVPEVVETCLTACLRGSCTPEEVQACVDDNIPGNLIDSVLAMDLDSLEILWSHRSIPYDAWANPCFLGTLDPINCPQPPGPDFDFGQGPTLYTAASSGRQLVGAGQKSGVYWALDPDTGEVVWSTQVGPGGLQGGTEWGSATDGERVYVAISNSDLSDWELQGHGAFAGFVVNQGFWSALDAATGEILWQTPEERRADLVLKGPKGPVTVANGVLYGGTTTKGIPDMYAFDAATGEVLWRYSTGGTVNSGAAVVDGVLYWGAVASSKEGEGDSAYVTQHVAPEAGSSFFAFCVPGTEPCDPVSGEG